MTKAITFLTLLALAVPAMAATQQLTALRNTLSDVRARSAAFSARVRGELRRGTDSQNQVVAAAGDLSRGAEEMQNHLDSKQVDAINKDLEIMGGARDGVDQALAESGAGPRTRSDWKLLRSAVDSLFTIVSGDARPAPAADGEGGVTVTRVNAPDAPEPGVSRVVAPAPGTETHVSLIGVEDLHFAAGDVSAILEALSGQIQRWGRLDEHRREALAALAAMHQNCDAMYGAPTIEDFRVEAARLTTSINAVDRTMPHLGDYGTRRPLWQQARKLALGILAHTSQR